MALLITVKKGGEDVFLRDFRVISGNIFHDYPLFHRNSGELYMLSIYPEYHTKLLPDSKLNNENDNLIQDISVTNSIEKVYLTSMRGVEKLKCGDLLAMYRTSDSQAPASYRSVVTSICTVVEVKDIFSFKSYSDFLAYCGKHTVFKPEELQEFWEKKKYRFILKFLYNANLPKRIPRIELLERGIIGARAYAGFVELTIDGFRQILKLGEVNAHFIVSKT